MMHRRIKAIDGALDLEIEMKAVRIERRLDTNVLPELIPLIGKCVEIIVLEREEPGPRKGPKAGSAKGKVTMSPDFDAPLEDFVEYTE